MASGPPPDDPSPGRDLPDWSQPPSYQQQSPDPMQPPPGYGAPPAQQGSNGLAIAALIVGILSILLGLFLFFLFAGLGLGLVAVVLGVLGSNRARAMGGNGRGLAIAGIVTGLLGGLINLVIILGIFTMVSDPANRDRLQDVLESFSEQAESQGG